MFVSRNRVLLALALVLAASWAGSLGLVSSALGSDHQDTPEVELNPRCDINDVYVFPNPSDEDRICLVMTTSSPIPAGQGASFDPDKLYQIKVDNDVTDAFVRDGVEDFVLQFVFNGSGAGQTVEVRGPTAVSGAQTGPLNKLLPGNPVLTGAVGTTLGSATGLQVYCGLRDDPFFLDLSQFFRIVPDRRPSTGPLSVQADQDTTCFRAQGDAEDYLANFNCLAIVVEMEKAQLTSNGANPRLGIWGTISR